MSAEPLLRPEFPDFSFAVPDARATPRRSPAVAKRSHMSGSWDDIAGSKRMLKASLNSEDLSLLLDSLESSRASPSLSRALRLSPAPSPATSRFLSSPAIPRKLSQSLSSLLALSQHNIPMTGMTCNAGAQQTYPSAQLCASPAVPRAEMVTSTSSALPTLSVTPPVPATPPNEHLAAPTALCGTAPAAEQTHSSSGSVIVEQSGHVPASVHHGEYASMAGVTSQQHSQGGAHMQPGYMPQASELGFYAEQVVLPPTQSSAGYSLHVPAEGEAFNYSYVAKCVDGSHNQAHGSGLGPQAGWAHSSGCKCGAKDFRSQNVEAHSPSECKAKGDCPVCSTKNFVVSESDSKQLARKLAQLGRVAHKHGGVKTYHCSVEDCDKTFITRKEQQNHIARHSAEPRYYCEYSGCNCKYTTKSSLDLHVTRIHGEKRFRCELCEERYSVRGDLNQHMKRKHMKQRRV